MSGGQGVGWGGGGSTLKCVNGHVREKTCVCAPDVPAGCVRGRSAAGGGSLDVRTSSWGDFRRG